MADQAPRTRIVAGCMTGTSLDGLDVALVKIIGTGLEMKAELLAHHAVPMPDRLRSMLLAFAQGEPAEPMDFMRAARALGRLHLEGIQALLAGGLVPPIASPHIPNSPAPLDFVTAHGQTIWHAPGDAPRYDAAAGPKSWQLFDPWPIVRELKVPVCYDLRQADLIAGGEGAPLTPIADWVMYRDQADIVANLGGVLNITRLGDEPSKIEGADRYPCNLLLDGLCQRLVGKPYDTDGELARHGQPVPAYVEAIYQAVRDACAGRRSLGREQFSAAWFDGLMAAIGRTPSAADVLYVAARLVAVQLGGAFREAGLPRERLVLAGGGAKHQTLVRLIDELGYRAVALSDDLGIPCEAREAMGFAVLGALSQDGIPISLPQVTGATDPGVAGVWAYA